MSEARTIVEVSELCVAQDGVVELDKLSFKLAAGEALIVLGDAASGKDALLRVLDGTAGRGEELSGTGPKAGGPNYLLRFALERTYTVNTAAAGGNAALLSTS